MLRLRDLTGEEFNALPDNLRRVIWARSEPGARRFEKVVIEPGHNHLVGWWSPTIDGFVLGDLDRHFDSREQAEAYARESIESDIRALAEELDASAKRIAEVDGLVERAKTLEAEIARLRAALQRIAALPPLTTQGIRGSSYAPGIAQDALRFEETCQV